MDAEKVIRRDQKYVLPTYNRNPLVLEEGRGLRVRAAGGESYLDFTSGIGVNSLGFCDPEWVAAVSAQAAKLQHASNLYYTAPSGKLAKKLCRRTGFDKVFFANSGAEANEGAIKCARKYSFDRYGPGRDTIVTLVNSFHGRTIATLTATGQEVFHRYFGPFNGHFTYVPAGDLETLSAALDGTVCAVMMELVQGEGGVTALDANYVKGAVELCRQQDVLVAVDEVQTGIGRTGTFLSYEQFGFLPDIVSLAKGLGGGLPIGAVLLTEAAAASMGPGTHGSTFGGNPVAAAGANVVMDRFADEALLDNVRARSAQLRKGLEALPHVAEVSGLGLMVGLRFEEPVKAAAVLAACREAGLLVLTAKERLRLLPPLTVSAGEVGEALAILEKVLEGGPA